MFAAGMDDENARQRVCFLGHVREMMAVVARKSVAQHNEVELILANSFFDGPASNHGLHRVTGFFHHGGMRERLSVSLAVQNLCLARSFPHLLPPRSAE